VVLQIPYRPPYDWDSMLQYLRARAIDGLEVVEDGLYRRSVTHEGLTGRVTIEHRPDRQSLLATICFPSVRALQAMVSRIRHQFDIGADVDAIAAHLSKDEGLAPLVAARPGLRAPGCWDGFELAVRAVLGQQITVAAARRLGGALVELWGEPLLNSEDRRLTRTFPTASRLAVADLSRLGMPSARRATITALAQAATTHPGLLLSGGLIDERLAQLRTIPGIGAWTAHYIALRAFREPDAFPVTDLGLLRSATHLTGEGSIKASSLLQRAEAWRPWRAYAAQYLWTIDQ
jgi:AraC family transcriptional regulator of adaptative response / DNA-3-methyladenine glycosylase II